MSLALRCPSRITVRACTVCLLALAILFGSEASAQGAIVFVGTSSAHTVTTGATTLPLTKPTSVVSGQVEIATIAVQGSSTISPPTGWTQIIDTQVGTALRQTSFWHVAGASEATTNWGLSPSTQAAGGIVAYSGVDTTTIIDASGQQTGTSGSAATDPSVTALYSGDQVIGLESFANSGTVTSDAAAAGRYTSVVATTNGPTMAAEDEAQASSGATAVQTGRDSATTTAWIGQTIALKAASAAGVLSVATSAAPSFSANLDAGDQLPTYAVPLTTVASVSPAPGWNETITSTQLTTGTHTLSAGASTITAAPTVLCNSAKGNCTTVSNSVAYPVNVPAGSGPPAPVKFFNAAVGSGAGQFTFTPTITVTVPQNSFRGTYTSTVTLAIVSGP